MSFAMPDVWISMARDFATKAHAGQSRKYTGEPYIVHPVRVSEMARLLGMGPEARIAALLHDTVEDCGKELGDIEKIFGNRVAALVGTLTDLQTPEDGNREMRKQNYVRRLEMSEDMEAQTLKLLDLADNAKSIREHDPKFFEIFQKEARDLQRVCRKALVGAHQMLHEALVGAP